MNKIIIDTGIQKFEVNEGKFLRFNPSDMNLYKRFIDAQGEFLEVEKRLLAKAEEVGDAMTGEIQIRLVSEADAEMKVILNRIFGKANDFDDMFEGVNLMAVGENGERIITNFLAAITPIIEAGAKKAARAQAAARAAQIKGNRAQRRAQK